MKIHVDDKFLGIQFDSLIEQSEVLEFFKYQDNSLVFLGGSYNKNRIRNIQFLKKQKDWYLTNSGFLKELLYFCRDSNFKVTLFDDKRTKFPHQKDYTDEEITPFFPFDYNEHQIRVMKKILKTNIGIIKAPTSAGKTEMIIAFVKLTNLPTLILVNKVSLAIQINDRLKKSGVENVGLYHGTSNVKGNIVVATIGSMRKVPNLTEFKALIIDEVHRAVAKQFQTFLRDTSYPIRIGFSATPEGNDKYKWATVRQYLGDVVEEVKVKELLDNNVIAKPIIKFIPIEAISTPDWPTANEYCIVKSDIRNNRIKELCLHYEKPTLILVRIIEHGEELEKTIPNSFFINGSHSPEERENAIKRFTSGEIKYLISSNIFNEGISINAIRVLIIASGGKSKIETVQKIGRSLRLDTGKTEALVFDFDDYGNRYTERHSKMRKEIYKRVGFEILE